MMMQKRYIVSSDILTLDRVSDAGSKMLQGFVSPFAATVAERLDKAGFMLLEQAAVEEFALTPTAHSRSAEAAIRHCALAVVSDHLGQARALSASSSLSAFKPSYGVLSRLGLVAVSASMDTIALLAPTVALCSEAMRVMVGSDEADATSVALDWPQEDDYLNERFNGKSIGVIREAIGGGESASSVRSAMEMLSQMGADVTEISLADYDKALGVAQAVVMAEFASAAGRYDGVKFGYRAPMAQTLEEIYCDSRAAFGLEAKKAILMGTLLESEKYYESHMLPIMRLRGKLAYNLRALLKTCDALLTPVTSTFAETCLANLAGLPAVSVNWPGGSGLQLIGAFLSDARLLGMGAELERAKMRLAGGIL